MWCPKCGGILFTESDIYGTYQCCLMCGYNVDAKKEKEQKMMTCTDGNLHKSVKVECPYCSYVDDKEKVKIHVEQDHYPRRPPLGNLTKQEKAELMKTGVEAFADRHGYRKDNRSILWQAYYRYTGLKSVTKEKRKNGANNDMPGMIVASAKPTTYLRAVINAQEDIPLVLSYLNSITEIIKSGRVEISMSYVGNKDI